MPTPKTEDELKSTITPEGQPLDASGTSSGDGEESNSNPDDSSAEEIQEVLIGDAEPEVITTESWVQDVRRRNRELARQNRELQERLQGKPAPMVAVPTLGKKPTIDDFNLDTNAYEQALEKWYAEKGKVEAAQAEAKLIQDRQKETMAAKLTVYRADAAKLKLPDFEDYEAAVLADLDETQYGIIVNWSSKAALVVAALGRNPKQLAELAKIKDPMSFGWAISKLEDKLKVASRKPATAPERAIGGGGTSISTATGGGADEHLEKLRARAAITGDLTPVQEYKRKLKAEAARRA